MVTVHAEGVIARHIDDEIGAMVYSMIGEPSVEAQLRHHLALSQKSVHILHTQLKDLQHKHEELEARYNGAKEEASMTATALRQKIGEFDTLKESFGQLSKECELFRDDREIFAEAADDAEERRAEADKRAAEAELRALQAEQRERAAVSFIDNVLKSQHGDKLQTFSSPEIKARWAAILGTENTELSSSVSKSQKKVSKGEGKLHESCGTSRSTTLKKMQVGRVDTAAQSPVSMLSKDARGTKRVLFDACKSREEIRNVVQRRASKVALMDRNKFSGTIRKVGRLQARNSDEKENLDDLEAEAQAKIEEAARSDNETARYLADLLVILKRNLVKAEAEGDFIYTKYCEIHKLLMDTLETFGILPEICEGRTRADDTLTVKST